MGYSLAAWVGAHTDLMNRVNAGAGASTVKIKSAAGTTLAEATIDEADSEVDALTGVLTFEIDVQETDATAGTASYVQVCDGDGDPHIELPCQAGSSAVAGYAVLNTLNILGGNLVDVLMVQIAPPAGSII